MLDISREEEDPLRSNVPRKILESLAFSSMTQRYEDVADAHQETFEWIFMIRQHSSFSGLTSRSGLPQAVE
jgi:hypothetical protein